MSPLPSPRGTPHAGRQWVWAVDEVHLPNYLLPRQCPRVCWATRSESAALLASPAGRVIAVEHGWMSELTQATLHVHELDPSGFTLLDAAAGYWINEGDVPVHEVQRIDDCLAALAERAVELRATTSLWPYADAVVADGGEFSLI